MDNETRMQYSIWRHQYIEKSYYYRGRLIDTFNLLEKSIEHLLMDYFTPHNDEIRIDFRFIILDRLSFQSKKDSLLALMNRYAESKGFIKTGSNSWPHSEVFKDIQFAQDERNRFAHYFLIIPEVATDDFIILAEMRDGKGLINYDSKTYFDSLTRIQNAKIGVNSFLIR